ncbi:MAG: hypothetical protein QME64_00215 [bacterium]|nr:hypothetical protein [bacterium]
MIHRIIYLNNIASDGQVNFVAKAIPAFAGMTLALAEAGVIPAKAGTIANFPGFAV